MAKESLSKNLENPLFVELFSQKLKEIGAPIPQNMVAEKEKIEVQPESLISEPNQVDNRPLNEVVPNNRNNNNRRRYFYIVSGVVIVGIAVWAYVKISTS